MSVRDLIYSKNRDLSKSDHVCGSESCHEQRRLLRTSEKELMLLIRLEKVTKPSLKCLDSTNPQSDRLCTNGGNSRPLLPSREVVDQQRSLQIVSVIVIVCEVAKVPRVKPGSHCARYIYIYIYIYIYMCIYICVYIYVYVFLIIIFYLKSFRIVLVRLYEHDDHVTLWDLSCH